MMETAFPYTRYACPCRDTTSTTSTSLVSKRSSQEADNEVDERDAFNPHDPRSNYALQPIDQLLFCDECNHTRCSKCWSEEMLYWYCPSCLFDVPSNSVKSDGNRCTRHCYNCPICAANLAVTALHRQSETHLRPADLHSTDSYILQCQHCEWSSIDIGVRFNKPTKITEQLNKIWKARHGTGEESEAPEEEREQHVQEKLQCDLAFANLSKFYKDQLGESGDTQNLYSSSPYSSPANLARIMNLYGGLTVNALKKTQEKKPQPMREAGGRSEGLSAYTEGTLAADDKAISKLKTLGLASTSTSKQKLASPPNYDARFVDQLWPVATPLRTRRGRRCRTCRQFLARPEGKVGSMRYKIRLLAAGHIQRLSIRPLQPTETPNNPSFRLRTDIPEVPKLQPYQPLHYVLTVRNPQFETVKVTLSTPSTTPGRVSSRVTILCPSFTVGPAGDMWDEALSASTSGNGVASDGGRRAAMASLTGSSDADRQPEAGKVWERSRSATSVILEVVPGVLKEARHTIVPVREEQSAEDVLREDDDVLEIPIFVRAEWEADPSHGADHAPAGEKKERESKELAYWCVLGVGRIAG